MTIATGQVALAADILKHATQDGYFQLDDSTELTIAAGVVTIAKNFHRIDTQSDAATDDLDTITLGANMGDGFVLFIRPENTARTVVVKHNTGNILCENGVDISLEETRHLLVLTYDGTLSKWIAGSAGGGVASAILKRQGGSPTEWSGAGTTNYSPGQSNIQMGVVSASYSLGQASVNITVTVPTTYAFSMIPMASIISPGSQDIIITQCQPSGWPSTPSTSQFVITIKPFSGATFAGAGTATIAWFASGPSA